MTGPIDIVDSSTCGSGSLDLATWSGAIGSSCVGKMAPTILSAVNSSDCGWTFVSCVVVDGVTCVVRP